MKIKTLQSTILFITLTATSVLNSQTLREQAVSKIQQLETSISQAEALNLNIEKEKMTLRTANIFMRYADWDADNVAKNKIQFELISTYRNNKTDKQGRNLDAVVNYLPTHHRQQIIEITEAAIQNIEDLKNSVINRPDYRTVDYENLSIKKVGDAEMVVETIDGVDIPSFFHTYTFKPEFLLSDINDSDSEKIDLREYHGHAPDMYTSVSYLKENGDLTNGFYYNYNTNVANRNRISKLFLGHTNLPSYVKNQNLNKKDDTKSIYAGSRLFIKYDIDNSVVENLISDLLNQVIPIYTAGTTDRIGYLMANEPHFATIDNDYFTPNTTGNQQTECDNSPTCNNNLISYHTMKKFEAYLKNIYGDDSNGLDKLNNNWFGTNTGQYFNNYSEIAGSYIQNQAPNYGLQFPIQKSDVGSPKIYDWFKFNNSRVTDWFQSIHDVIKANDSEARTHIKLIPSFFSARSTRDAGLDFEDLQEIQEIIGNDAKTKQVSMNGKHEAWQDRYHFHWTEMAPTFDFLSSVKPNAINYNSENHYVSTNQFRDLYLTPSYVRSAFWLGYLLGENISHIWYWPRDIDGSIRDRSEGTDNGYAASLIHQPAIVNEIGSVFYDLNAYADDIYKIQNSRKPIRIFHSETTAINTVGQMEHELELYEKLFFDGTPIGFATKKIIDKQDNSNWDVILVNKTPFVTDSEFTSLQNYLNQGGTLILDQESLKKNEYGQVRATVLNTNNGGSIINLSDLNSIRTKALDIIKQNGNSPKVNIIENQTLDTRGCFWRALEKDNGEFVVSIVNTRKDDSTIDISVDGFEELKIENLLNGAILNAQITLKPSDVLLLKISEKDASASIDKIKNDSKSVIVSPNPVLKKKLHIIINEEYSKGKIEIFDTSGKSQKELFFTAKEELNIPVANLVSGIYFAEVLLDDKKFQRRIVIE